MWTSKTQHDRKATHVVSVLADVERSLEQPKSLPLLWQGGGLRLS